MKVIKKFLENVRKESQPEINRINAFWDKKTLFVHRRALLIGIALGIILGADIALALYIVMISQ